MDKTLHSVPHIYRSVSLECFYYSKKYLGMMSGRKLYYLVGLSERIMDIFNHILHTCIPCFVLLLSTSDKLVFHPSESKQLL